MAPKTMIGQIKQNSTAALKKRITRSQNPVLNNVLLKQSNVNKDNRVKRKAEASPPKERTTKRSALGNITNAIGKSLGGQNHIPKKPISHVKTAVNNNVAIDKVKSSIIPSKPKPVSRPKAAVKKDQKTEISKKIENTKHSLDLEKSEDNSLYVSALEDVIDSSTIRTRRSTDKNDEKKITKIEIVEAIEETEEKQKESPMYPPVKITIVSLGTIPKNKLPEGVEWDFDVENWLDPFQVSNYAMDIFNYLKEREKLFPISNYMPRQVCLTPWMRALLVDWMVEVQESFELNHETLYLAVKLVDLYLTKVTVGKETLQLLGAASLFISSKYDERIPPMVEDFLYICDSAYSQKELIRMEMNILKVIDFDLGIPLSYRFLRRYARCAKVSMPTLTLARYILEYSLMDYSFITFSDSKIAAAALSLALLMKDLQAWNPTLEYYTGYTVKDFKDLCNLLNEGLQKEYKEPLETVRNKYSHKIFFEVAKLPLKKILKFNI